MTLKLIRIRRLKQLQAERGAAGPAELGALIGRKGNQTSDLLHGRKAFGEKVARSIEEHAGLPPGWLDDPVSSESESRTAKSRARLLPESRDAVPVPLLRVGDTSEPPEIFLAPLLLSSSWLTRLGLTGGPANLRFFHVSEVGMQPTFNPGDALLVDTGVRGLTRDGVHLIDVHGRGHLRRLRLRIDGSAEVSEDSPTARTVEVVPVSTLKITGRVIWVWAGRGV